MHTILTASVPAVVPTPEGNRFEVHLALGRTLRGTAKNTRGSEQILAYLLVGDWPVFVGECGLTGGTWKLGPVPAEALELRRRRDGKILETLRVEAGAKDRSGFVFGSE